MITGSAGWGNTRIYKELPYIKIGVSRDGGGFGADGSWWVGDWQGMAPFDGGRASDIETLI